MTALRSVLHAADVNFLSNLAPVAKQLLEKAGFKVDMQSMDWQSLLARIAKKDGWHVFLTSYTAPDIADPVVTLSLNAYCARGWRPCDDALEKLRNDFVRATEPTMQRAIAEAVQLRAIEVTTHIPLGQYYYAAAAHKSVKGILPAPVTVFWNVRKQ